MPGSDKEFTVQLKSTISNDLSGRFGFGFHYNNILMEKPKVNVFASLLDSRYKNLNRKTIDNVKQHIQQTVKSLIQSYEGTYEKDQVQITKNTTAMDILFGETENAYDEFQQYINEN